MSKKRIILIAILFYLIIGILFTTLGPEKTGRSCTLNSSNFEFYYSYTYNFLTRIGISMPESSQIIYNSCERVSADWQPSPFYSLLAFSAIAITGSKTILAAQGLICGSIIIWLTGTLGSKYIFKDNDTKMFILWIILFAVNPTFIYNSIGFSPMSASFMVALIGLTINRWSLKIAIFPLAIAIRSSSIIFILAYMLSTFWVLPSPTKRKHLAMGIWLIICYFTFYKWFYSGYPISFPSALLIYEGSGFQSWETFASQVMIEKLGVASAIGNTISIKQILSEPEIIYVCIQNYFVKLFVLLGGQFDGLNLAGGFNLQGVRVFKSMLLWLIFLPGFFKSLKNCLAHRSSNIDDFLSAILAASVLISALLIANTRYTLPVIPIAIYLGIEFWREKQSNDCRPIELTKD